MKKYICKNCKTKVVKWQGEYWHIVTTMVTGSGRLTHRRRKEIFPDELGLIKKRCNKPVPESMGEY